jgi:hypothetical protein
MRGRAASPDHHRQSPALGATPAPVDPAAYIEKITASTLCRASDWKTINAQA